MFGSFPNKNQMDVATFIDYNRTDGRHPWWGQGYIPLIFREECDYENLNITTTHKWIAGGGPGLVGSLS